MIQDNADVTCIRNRMIKCRMLNVKHFLQGEPRQAWVKKFPTVLRAGGKNEVRLRSFGWTSGGKNLILFKNQFNTMIREC